MINRTNTLSFALSLSALLCIRVTADAQVTSGLAMWVKADAGVTSDAQGHVSAWADQSGSNHNASVGNASNQPVLVNNALGGKPVLRFDGINDFFNVNGQVLASQQFTIITVVDDQRASGDTTFREIFSNWNNNLDSVFFGTTSYNPIRARLSDYFGGATDPLHTQTGVGVINNPTSPFIYTGVSGATDATVYQNSSLLAAKGSALPTLNLTSPYNIGKQGTANVEYWSGDIAEILVYNRVLSQAEFGQNVTYLQGKYFGIAPVPEPGAFALLAGAGFAGAALLRRRRR